MEDLTSTEWVDTQIKRDCGSCCSPSSIFQSKHNQRYCGTVLRSSLCRNGFAVLLGWQYHRLVLWALFNRWWRLTNVFWATEEGRGTATPDDMKVRVRNHCWDVMQNRLRPVRVEIYRHQSIYDSPFYLWHQYKYTKIACWTWGFIHSSFGNFRFFFQCYDIGSSYRDTLPRSHLQILECREKLKEP